jgi:putative transposase
LLGLSRSGYYYHPLGEDPDNLLLMAAMDRLHTDEPTYGYRRILAHLPDVIGEEEWQRIGPINPKRIRRLMDIMDIQAIYQKPDLSKPHPSHTKYPYLLRGLQIDRPNHVWSCDITYIPMKKGFMYLIAVIDWYSRYVLSWELSNSMTADFCIRAVCEAFNKYGSPEIFNTDQGSQFTSNAFLDALRVQPLRISMDGRGRALDNIFIERLWRTIKYEHIYLYSYEDGLTLHRGLRQYFEKYNTKRRHQSLEYKTPSMVYFT